MFYVTLSNLPQVYCQKTKAKNFTFRTAVSKYYPTTFLRKDSVIIFLKQLPVNLHVSPPLVARLARLAGVAQPLAKHALEDLLVPLVKNFSFNSLYFFITKLF